MGDRTNTLYRKLDFYLGIPTVRVLGLFKRSIRSSALATAPTRIGILATAAIGDTILLSAPLQEIRQIWPEAEMLLFVGSSNEAIARLICPVHQIQRISINRPDQAIGTLRQAGWFDLWIDAGPWPRINACLTAFAQAEIKIGFRTPGQYRHFTYHWPVDHRRDRHELENLRALVDGACAQLPHLWNSDRSSPPISRPIPQLDPQTLPPLTDPPMDPYVVIHMFPGGYRSHFKEWSARNWRVLLQGLIDRGLKVVLTGAPKDQAAAQAIVKPLLPSDRIDNRAGHLNLGKTATLVSNARVVISVNTGIMHLAAALNRPLIALHGPTDPQRWGPIAHPNVPTLSLAATSPSAGCLHLGFEYDPRDPHSMDTIPPELVLEKTLALWSDLLFGRG